MCGQGRFVWLRLGRAQPGTGAATSGNCPPEPATDGQGTVMARASPEPGHILEGRSRPGSDSASIVSRSQSSSPEGTVPAT